MFISEPYLISLCSAAAMAFFLYVKGSTIVPDKSGRAAVGLAVLVAGTAAIREHAAFSALVVLLWLALAVAVSLVARALWQRASALRRIWEMLDSISSGSLIAAGVYALAEIILYPGKQPRELTLLAAVAMLAGCVHIFHELDRAGVLQRPPGLVFGEALVISGLIPWCFGFRHANVIAYASLAAGTAIVISRLTAYYRKTEEHRVIENMSADGDRLKPEYSNPTPECPEPRLWSMYDPMTAEKEVLDLLYAIVRAAKPGLAVETGTFSGISSTYIARAMQDNGRGRLITCEFDRVVHEKARERFHREGVSSVIDCQLGSSLELQVEDEIDLLYCDSALEIREAEVRCFLKDVSPYGLILMHDASSDFEVVREAALRMEAEGLISVVLISTPRGLVVAQKREGRK